MKNKHMETLINLLADRKFPIRPIPTISPSNYADSALPGESEAGPPKDPMPTAERA